MKLKAALLKEFRLIAICFAAIISLQISAAYFASAYQKFVFTPLQFVRNTLCEMLPFSLGDCLYAGIIIFLSTKFVRTLVRAEIKSPGLSLRLWVLLRRLSGIYLIILLLWGILYEQPKLYEKMALPELSGLKQEELITFDSLLIERLNAWHSYYRYPGLKKCNLLLHTRYKALGAMMPGAAKATLFGNGLAYLGIQGYYNPFTGEAQVNTNEPDFMMPFLIAHEMAHQTGIAAEDDANLAAYITCMESTDTSLRYSACFNIWMYVHRRVHRIDSLTAKRFKQHLNPTSLAHIHTLRQRSDKYETWLDDLGTLLFDTYLKMEQQEAGIHSYRNVAWSALAWEKKRNNIYLAR